MHRIVIRLTCLMSILAAAACSGTSGTSASMTPAGPSSAASVTAQSFSTTAPTASTQFTDHVLTDRHNDEQELEGVIASIDAGAHAILVGNTTVTVPATAVIRRDQTTMTFADLKVGDRVHVKGTRIGATLQASEIKVQHPESAQPDHVEGARAEGAVTGLQGACPAVTFALGNITITTSAATMFRNGSCSQLAAGVHVEARGTAQPDGSIQAVTVGFPESPDDHESDR